MAPAPQFFRIPPMRGNLMDFSMTARQKDILLGLIVVVVFTLVYFVVIPVQVPVLSPVRIEALSPDFWPKNITLFIVFLGIFQTLYSMFRTYPKEEKQPRTDLENFRDLLLGFLLVAYCFAAPILGVLLSSIIIMACAMLLFGERRILPLIFWSIIVPLCMQLFLTKIAMIMIPQGILPI